MLARRWLQLLFVFCLFVGLAFPFTRTRNSEAMRVAGTSVAADLRDILTQLGECKPLLSKLKAGEKVPVSEIKASFPEDYTAPAYLRNLMVTRATKEAVRDKDWTKLEDIFCKPSAEFSIAQMDGVHNTRLLTQAAKQLLKEPSSDEGVAHAKAFIIVALAMAKDLPCVDDFALLDILIHSVSRPSLSQSLVDKSIETVLEPSHKWHASFGLPGSIGESLLKSASMSAAVGKVNAANLGVLDTIDKELNAVVKPPLNEFATSGMLSAWAAALKDPADKLISLEAP